MTYLRAGRNFRGTLLHAEHFGLLSVNLLLPAGCAETWHTVRNWALLSHNEITYPAFAHIQQLNLLASVGMGFHKHTHPQLTDSSQWEVQRKCPEKQLGKGTAQSPNEGCVQIQITVHINKEICYKSSVKGIPLKEINGKYLLPGDFAKAQSH